MKLNRYLSAKKQGGWLPAVTRHAISGETRHDRPGSLELRAAKTISIVSLTLADFAGLQIIEKRGAAIFVPAQNFHGRFCRAEFGKTISFLPFPFPREVMGTELGTIQGQGRVAALKSLPEKLSVAVRKGANVAAVKGPPFGGHPASYVGTGERFLPLAAAFSGPLLDRHNGPVLNRH